MVYFKGDNKDAKALNWNLSQKVPNGINGDRHQSAKKEEF